jgi:hypothetical protein
MAATSEDQRAAVTIQIGLGSSIVTATLAVLGAQGAIAVFVMDKREHLSLFYTVSMVGWGFLMASMLVGGKGIAAAYRSGFDGNWRVQSHNGEFVKQVWLALAGVTLVVLSTACGVPKAEDERRQLQTVTRVLADVTARVETIERDSKSRGDELRTVREQLQRVSDVVRVHNGNVQGKARY